MNSGNNKVGINDFSEISIEEILSKFQAWHVFILSENIASKIDFFRSIKDTLPLDPMVLSNSNWDALSDSLWSGIDNLDEAKIVVIWPNSRLLRSEDPEAFSTSTEVLDDVAKSLHDEEATLGKTKEVVVIQCM